MPTHASTTRDHSSPAPVRQPAREAVPTVASRRPAPIVAPPAFDLGGSAALDPRIRIPANVGDVIRSPGPGEPLPIRTQSSIEAGFGADLRAVRVHSDPRSAAAVDQLSARAFTVGTHIFLGSRERLTDLSLIAHEAAHVVQQQGGAAVQRKSAIGSVDSLEREADRSSTAVQHGERTTILGRSGSPGAQFLFGWVRRGISAIGRGVRAVAGAVADVVGNIIERAVNYIREHARSIPGYDLLGFILGRDPLTQQPVERNAVNLIRGLLGLIPGGAAMFENLQRARVIERAFQWVTAELARLNLSWGVIRGAIDRFLSSLGPGDILNLGGVFDRARAIFGPILSRILTFAAAAGRKILEFIFEGALALAGGAAQRILAIFRRIGATFSLIVNDPVQFLRNLINAVKGGFERFAARILEHLRTALFEWLFGALQGAGLRLPARFNLEGIMSIVLQVLGLTYARLRERLVRLIGEPAVATLERVFEFLRILVTQGIAAAWQKILEFASGLVDTVIEAIRNWVITTIVRAAVTRIATMFNPVGAIINAIITIYNTVMFVIERARQIAAFVESVIDSIDNIAHGNIGAAITYVERTLARILSLVISFLARLIGLGGISDTIRNIIRRIQTVVDRAIDRVVNWIVERARGLASRALGGDPNAPPQLRLDRGMDEAEAAVNRYAGRTVGAVVLRPLLGAVKLRHRLTRLDVVLDGNNWTIEGEVNPRKRKPTRVKGTGHGSFTTKITYYPEYSTRGGKRMVSNPLGPDHPAGSSPSAAGAPPIWPHVNLRRNGERLYVLGHLLNEQLGGVGNTQRNLTPITFSANKRHESRVESKVKDLVKPSLANPWAYYEVVVNFPSRRTITPAEKAKGVADDEGLLASTLNCTWHALEPDAADPTKLKKKSGTDKSEIIENVPPYPNT